MSHLKNPGYKPNILLDQVKEQMKFKNDAALARALGVKASVISKVRHLKLVIGDSLLIRLHEATGKPTKDLKRIAGMV